MRVLFTCVPLTGHFHPLVPFAKALQTAGHEVAFATALDLSSQVEAAGFAFFEAGANPALLVSISGVRELPLAVQREMVRQRLFPELLPQRMLPDLMELFAKWQPDLIVSEENEFAGRVVAEARGISHAVIKVSQAEYYAHRYSFVAAMNNLRAMVDLPPDPQAEMLYRYLYLIPEPPRLRSGAEILPPTSMHVKRVIFDQSGKEEMPQWAANLNKHPTVFATMGTVYNKQPGQLENILEALRDEPINLIVTIGRDRDPAEFGVQPPNVYLERYIPESLIFPVCNIVVSHCGNNTMLAALEYGLPMVNLPFAADQPDNAADCARLGVGLRVPLEGRTPEAIREGVRQVLVEPSYRENARQLQKEMAGLPGMEEVVIRFEKLVQQVA